MSKNNGSKKPFKLLIGTCFYEVKGYSPYIKSLVESIKGLNIANIEFDFYEHAGDSYVDRAKNTMAHRFMESDFTHLFMIDSDLQWDTKGFFRVIADAKMGLDVVGGAFPNKNNWKSYGTVPLIEDGSYMGIEKGNLRVMEAICVPGGFLIYSRKAFEMVQSSIKHYYDTGSGLKGLENKFYEYFRCDIASNGGRIGEDVYFQQKFRQAGGKVFLEPNITFHHWGVKGWNGNYHNYLLTKKADYEKMKVEHIQKKEEELCQT